MMTRKRTADWEKDFYKNGYPKEVIVIEDSPTPSPPSPAHYANAPYTSTFSSHVTRKRQAEQLPVITKRTKLETMHTDPIFAFHVLPTPTIAYTFQMPPPIILQPPPMPPVYDDKDGHYLVRLNESLTPQYKIMRLLGQGTFGKVVECYDRVRRTFCAIKIIRAIPKYRDASKIEIRVLNTLKKHDPLNLNKCIHLVEWFDYQNHICMVFELLGQSVFDFLKANHFKPFPHHHIQQLAKQLLTSVAFLHDLKLIHTDLKPENILLVNRGSNTLDENTDIRLIDFGSATFEQEYHSAIVSTRHYRAPEIIMGLGWSYPCDMWSMGCILIEFFIGDALFQTHDNLEHLAMMESVLGPIPTHMVTRASKEAQKLFEKDSKKLNYPLPKTSRQSKRLVSGLKPLDVSCEYFEMSLYSSLFISKLCLP
ncbi:Putative CMGC/CLK protein kinase [Rhizopus microsporus]|nr:Putative CMGC/CLK protein kinase [Rhizopus microsporus]